MSSPTSAEPALLAVAPRRQNRGTREERDRPTSSQLRRGGLFGIQRGNVRSEGKPADLCLRIQEYLPPPRRPRWRRHATSSVPE
jgi:hypothetical protein